jgi:hypothetical protein
MPYRFWQIDKWKNTRSVFEKYAQQNNLDPLQAETWYMLNGPQLRQSINQVS